MNSFRHLKSMTRASYLTDLGDQEWILIEPLIPLAKGDGPPPEHASREILNAIYYLLRAGCAWRLLPHDAPALENRLSLFSVLAGQRSLGEN
jgi:hypothetical protein